MECRDKNCARQKWPDRLLCADNIDTFNKLLCLANKIRTFVLKKVANIVLQYISLYCCDSIQLKREGKSVLDFISLPPILSMDCSLAPNKRAHNSIVNATQTQLGCIEHHPNEQRTKLAKIVNSFSLLAFEPFAIIILIMWNSGIFLNHSVFRNILSFHLSVSRFFAEPSFHFPFSDDNSQRHEFSTTKTFANEGKTFLFIYFVLRIQFFFVIIFHQTYTTQYIYIFSMKEHKAYLLCRCVRFGFDSRASHQEQSTK